MTKADVFELALGELPRASADVSKKWETYCSSLAFRDDTPLIEKIRLFSLPLAEFFRKRYPHISEADPAIYLSALLIGVYMAKTHPIPLVLEAASQMETDLDVRGIEGIVRTFVRGTPNL